MPKLVYNEQILSGGIPKNQVENILGNFATEYDSASTYAVGNYVVYDGLLYKCITAITEGEEFDSTKWEKTDCGSEFEKLNSNFEYIHDTTSIPDLRIEKYAGRVDITFEYQSGIDFTTKAWNTIATLPVQYRPRRAVLYFLIYNNATSVNEKQALQCKIESNGNIAVFVMPDAHSIIIPRGTVSFIAAE